MNATFFPPIWEYEEDIFFCKRQQISGLANITLLQVGYKSIYLTDPGNNYRYGIAYNIYKK